MPQSTLEGVAAVTKQLEALKSLDDGKAMRRAVGAGIKPAREHAKQTIPVGTKPHRLSNGLLVNSGFAKSAVRTVTTINAAKNIASGVLGVRKLAYYAVAFLERGTRKMPAQPWLVRSLTETRGQCEEALRDSLAKSVEKAAKTQ